MRRAIFLSLLLTTTALADPFKQTIPQKWLTPILPEKLPALTYPSYATPLDRAKMEVFHGRYRKSLLTLLDAGDAIQPAVALVRGEALAALGRSDEALAALAGDNPSIVLARAKVLADAGRLEEARKLIDQLLKDQPDSLQTRFEYARLAEAAGDTESARRGYEWFVNGPGKLLETWKTQRERAFDNAADLVLVGRAVDRWASLTGAYQKLPDLHDVLLDLFVRAYDVVDRDYWPARLASAEYFLSHDNNTAAVKELEAALEANPNSIAGHDLLGKIAVDSWKFDAADEQVEAIRDVDPNSSVADLLAARNLLQQRSPAAAQRVVQGVLDRQPRHIEALSLLAATAALQLQDEQTTKYLKQVEAIDPNNATAYFEVAEQLGAMRQYPRAIEKYKVAIERAPWWTAARNGLGLLYTQSGDEDDAQATLDAAHTLDPYNLRTTNYLRLLEDLAGYARKETDHFVVIYDAKADPVIPEYFADYLESIHAEVSAAYKTEPPVKTFIEVFPSHDAFSVRTTGSPWIGTVGASTGRVIALVTPRKGEKTMGAFNWAQVLRHEYTHTVTLAATDNRIPHWMTEGLAVYQENSPLKWEWVPMLYYATTKDELFTIENLTWGFVRPRKPTDRSLAYAQSFWVCEYIEGKWGHDAIVRMLEMFRGGGTEVDTFQSVLGISRTEFQQQFFEWARAKVSTWGYDEESTKKYETLRDKGEALIKARKYADAIPIWESIAALRPVDALPHQRLAGLYLAGTTKQPAKAIEQLKILHAVELHDNRYAKRIARLYRDDKQLGNAQTYALQSVYIDPYDADAHALLLELATASNDAPVIEREKRVIEILKNWKAS